MQNDVLFKTRFWTFTGLINGLAVETVGSVFVILFKLNLYRFESFMKSLT